MEIRDALAEELALIRAQRIEAYREHAASIPTDHWQGLERAISSKADTQPGVELMVAVWEGEIVGSVALFPPAADAYEGHGIAQDYPEIRLLAVSAEARGKGVASALLSECIQRSKSKSFRAIGLHTGDFMKGALKLYEKIGFQRQPEYDFQPGDDGIIVKAFRLAL